MTEVIHAIRRALVGTGSTALNLLGACLIGFGVPLFWVWLASELYDKPGAVTGPVAVFIFTGILVSYWALLLIGSWVRGRMLDSQLTRTGPGRGASPGTAACATPPTAPATTAATRSSACS